MKVAPLAGAWIEILNSYLYSPDYSVAPLAGAWIEIRIMYCVLRAELVAPLAGAWIEMKIWNKHVIPAGCRSPCGSVD